MKHRRELTDRQWAALAPHLPPQKPTTGKPNQDHRRIVEGIIWRQRAGSPWREVPERFGKGQTVYSRFRRWQHAGIWDRILAALQAEADARGELDWALHFLDGTTIRAHAHAAGAPKKGAAIKPSAGAAAAFRPSSTCGPRVGANPSPGS